MEMGMSTRTFRQLLEEYSGQGDVQIKLVTGDKIHGKIHEVGEDVVILGLGAEKRLVNIRNIVLVSPGLL